MPQSSIGVLVKPAGPDCNLACTYCFYRPKLALYPDTRRHRMTEALLEEFIRQYMLLNGPQVSFGWQGGEPTLMGLDFFRHIVECQKRFGRAGQVVSNGLQTNGVLITEEWCRFLTEYKFLVGLSIDGPAEIHDGFRVYLSGRPTHADVVAAQRRMKAQGVDFNALCMVTPANAHWAEEVWHYLVDDMGFEYLQFIPLAERDPRTGRPAEYCVDPKAYGEFLCRIFDLWAQDPYRVHVRMFDDLMFVYAGMECPSCVFRARCGDYFVLEHNGDVYCCDFFVDPNYRLGNLSLTPLAELLRTEQFARFAGRKSELGAACQQCPWLRLCHGGCPKYRLINGDDPSRPTYFCPGYRTFFEHSRPEFERIVRQVLAQQRQAAPAMQGVGRNDRCPCGSGKKYKNCCMPR